MKRRREGARRCLGHLKRPAVAVAGKRGEMRGAFLSSCAAASLSVKGDGGCGRGKGTRGRGEGGDDDGFCHLDDDRGFSHLDDARAVELRMWH